LIGTTTFIPPPSKRLRRRDMGEAPEGRRGQDQSRRPLIFRSIKAASIAVSTSSGCFSPSTFQKRSTRYPFHRRKSVRLSSSSLRSKVVDRPRAVPLRPYRATTPMSRSIGNCVKLRKGGATPVFVLNWSENGGPPVATPAREGLGRRRLNRCWPARSKGVPKCTSTGRDCGVPLKPLSPKGSYHSSLEVSL
jgi:hypothetical protein